MKKKTFFFFGSVKTPRVFACLFIPERPTNRNPEKRKLRFSMKLKTDISFFDDWKSGLQKANENEMHSAFDDTHAN